MLLVILRLYIWYFNSQYLLVAALVLLSLSAGARPRQADEYLIDVQRYGVNDGLSSNHVYQIFQDSRGLYWVVTGRGLDFFDGNSFFHVLKWPTFYGYRIASIRTEDRRGNLWVRIEDGSSPEFLLVDIISRQSRPAKTQWGSILADVARDAEGKLWFITQRGDVWLQQSGSGALKIASGYQNFAFALPAFQKDLVWLHDKRTGWDKTRLVALDRRGDVRFKTAKLHTLQFDFFQEMSDGAVLEFNMEKLTYRGSSGEIRYVPVPFSKDKIFGVVHPEYTAHENPNGEKWIYLTRNGQLMIVRYDRQWNLLHSSVIATEYFYDLSALNLMRDSQGAIWMGGLEGVSKITLTPNRFKHYPSASPSKESYLLNSSRAISEGKDGSIYILSGPVWYRKRPDRASLDSLRYCPVISGMAVDGKTGTVYLKSGRLLCYNPDTEVCTQTETPQNISAKSFAWSLFDAGPTLWIGDDDGLWTLDKGTNRVSRFTMYHGFDALRRAEKYQIARKSQEELWILTNRGLFVLHEQKGVVAHYSNRLTGRSYLPGLNYYHLSQDARGNIWMASSEGLIQWSGTGHRLYTVKDGLPTNNIYAVYPDEYGLLWLNTDNGIVQFFPKTKALRIFFQSDGTAHNEGNRISHLKASDGTLYFGGLNGVNAFHPRDFKDFFQKTKTGSILLTDAVKYDTRSKGERSVLASYAKNKKLLLSPHDNMLTLQVATPRMATNGPIAYAFRIKKLSDEWITLKKPVIRLMSLPYGRMLLEVKAKSQNGLLTGALQVPIWVRRPFYLQAWFLLLLVLAIAGAIYSWVRYRLAFLTRQRAKLEEEVALRTAKITEDKVLIERQALELAAVNEEKSRFFANVTHEFRTPLSLIMGPVELMRKTSRGKTRERDLLDIAHRNAGRVLGLVDDILLLSVLETGQVHRQDTFFSPHHFVDNLLIDYRVLAAQKGIELEFFCPIEPTAFLSSDRRLLRTILNNLLSNAFKFTPRGGQIKVEVLRLNQQLCIQVSDTGRGIHPEDLPHIFERFYQTRRPGAAAEGGTGIGLALSAELAELLSGELLVESEFGKGACFTLYLPWRSSPDTDQKIHREYPDGGEAPQEPAYKRGLTRKSDTVVLLVEDNQDMQQYLGFLLENYYSVTVASNGKEALEHLDAGPAPALILSDLMMPEMDGMQLLSRLRKGKPAVRAIPFVMLTARINIDDKNTALRLGVDDYLGKPFTEKRLLAVVQELIGRYQARVKQADETAQKIKGGAKNELPTENEWLEQLQQETFRSIAKETFSVDQLATAMLMGRTNFYNEVKRLTGLTPNQYVLEARLMKARHLLETRQELTIKAILREVGLRDERYFTKMFKQRFGQLPSYFR